MPNVLGIHHLASQAVNPGGSICQNHSGSMLRSDLVSENTMERRECTRCHAPSNEGLRFFWKHRVAPRVRNKSRGGKENELHGFSGPFIKHSQCRWQGRSEIES